MNRESLRNSEKQQIGCNILKKTEDIKLTLLLHLVESIVFGPVY